MFITLRLSDSLPESKLEELIDYKLKYSDNPNNLEEIAERLRAIDNWLNKGHGSCILKYKPIQDVVDNTINFYDGNKYILFDYVIMSNHIHLLLIPNDPIRETMISFRRFTSRLINKITGKNGSVWQEDYFDRLIRNFKDFEETSDYIKTNPLGLKK